MTRLPTRLWTGALSGVVATAAMTAFMERAHQRLPPHERYPLPPREITAVIVDEDADRPETSTTDAALAAHFAFGAAAGALVAALKTPARPLPGALAGLAIWAASYFGWAPLFGILRPATSHPVRRTALMAAAHVVWGAVAVLTLAELTRARGGMLAPGPALDAQPAAPRAIFGKARQTGSLQG